MEGTLGKKILNYISLLRKNEDWLVKRILEYAKQYDFTKYTSTLQEAWRLSIHGVSESLIQTAIKYNEKIPGLDPDYDYAHDPALEFGIIEAKKHRGRGVTFSMFMGLMKYYRQSYQDLFIISKLSESEMNFFKLFTERAFDRFEIAYTKEWTSLTDEEIISELQTTNRNLANEKNKYLTIFEGFYSPLIVLDMDNTIVYFNLAASQLFSNIQIAGTLYYDKECSAEALKILNERLHDFIRSSLNELAFELYIETNLGQRFFLIKLKKMIDFSEKFRGTIIIFDDFTERKEMEHQLEVAKLKAEEADQLKTAFLANLSHEIRTPMNAIIGLSDLMLNESMNDDERKEYLKLIQKSGNTLLKLIDDIIDIAKIESNQLKLRPTDCNIIEVLEELHTIFEEHVKKENKSYLDLILDYEELETEYIFTDPDRLKQVFSNLLNNAIKFTYKGYVQFGCKQLDKKNLICYVKDTGVGIPKNKQSEIFERFYQLENDYTKEHGGTGLGLSITKNIVGLLCGDIWVESLPGEGSTFYFVLPVKFGNRPEPDKKKFQVPALKKKLSLKNYNILIAEDEEINYYYLSEILKKTGAKIIWAKNGLDAINIAESNTEIDLVLMDIKMPEINGLEAIKYIKTIRPKLPVVAQTAYVMDNDREICIKAGCVDFLSKPIKAHDLLEVVSSILTSQPLNNNSAAFSAENNKK